LYAPAAKYTTPIEGIPARRGQSPAQANNRWLFEHRIARSRVTLERMAPRPVLRILISSTAIDLTGYRDKVRDTVLRLESLPIAIETFSALGGAPASECMRMPAEADAVICIVARRYGYVPRVELGGDGERSITWLEVVAAKLAGKPGVCLPGRSQSLWTRGEKGRLVSKLNSPIGAATLR